MCHNITIFLNSISYLLSYSGLNINIQMETTAKQESALHYMTQNKHFWSLKVQTWSLCAYSPNKVCFLTQTIISFKVYLIVLAAPGWLSQLSIRLWLRSWSHSSWVQALHQARFCQHRASFRSSVPLSLCPCPTCALSQK